MSDWTKGYTMTQGMKEITEHIDRLQTINAELLSACQGLVIAFEEQNTTKIYLAIDDIGNAITTTEE